ncbi:MFS transporter [Denitrobaculum tricleocarpae]|uniref:MFS transporter n=1 Tax=Denitrobaculum tricleocarpae TaxID=2591009 RepID=A0A545TFX9_9PROT|nr:MFS transporter [Denitrobaculum tricleocarpae]TQV76129.1 MFS transporter [Denitrobaculum tricleocarpae]
MTDSSPAPSSDGLGAAPDVKRMPPGRVLAVLTGLYIAQAIPIYLFIAALPAIFREQGVSRTMIGAIGVLLIPWILKFLWAPIVDRYQLSRLGRRRSWILPMQATIIGLILVMSQLSPLDDFFIIFGIACLVALAASTQDIATDGYAVEVLTPAQRAYGNAIQGGSIAAGVLIGSAFALILYDNFGWQVTMFSIAALAGLAALPICLMQEKSAPEESDTAGKERPSLMAFLRRPDSLQVLAFALLYRCSEGFVKPMEQPFLVDQGLSLSLVGLTSGASAATVGLGGSLLAAFVIRKYGLFTCLYGLGLARTLCFAGFALAAASQTTAAAVLIGLAFFNTVIRYMEVVGLYSLYMGASSRNQPATDFTILSCAQLIIYMLASMVSGVLADWVGYAPLFTFATVLSLVGLIWCMRQIPQNHPAYAGTSS